MVPLQFLPFFRHFNPRSPHGERQQAIKMAQHYDAISIHAPRTGSDSAVASEQRQRDVISIHAPRTGSDFLSPCRTATRDGFQSTLPARGATGRNVARLGGQTFQSTLPARGATDGIIKANTRTGFQSTLPARGATRIFRDLRHLTSISIHAPRTGSDFTHSFERQPFF